MRRAAAKEEARASAGDAAAAADRGIARNLAEIAVESSPRGAEVRAAAHILHDDDATRDVVRRAVESAGFDAVCPATAFDLVLAEPAGALRMAVLGLTAVDERDLEIVDRLRARWPQSWIVVLHPAALRERAAKALARGADASLSEPFYPSEIAALARRALARTGPLPPAAEAPRPEAPVAAPPVAAPASAARPDALERLALAVANAIRTPVAGIEQGLAASESGADLDAESMRAQLRRLADLAAGLAGFAGPGDLALRPVDLANLVTGVFVSRDVGAAGAEIGVRLGDARVEILAAPDLLRTGLEALRNRAVRVTPPEGKITVRTRNRSEGGVRMVEISVTDGGPALTDLARTRLFDPFAESDEPAEGTGLELAALAGIVRAHGGVALALAAGATGTIVVIRLPVRESAGSSRRPDET